jgi:hypothetical protein
MEGKFNYWIDVFLTTMKPKDKVVSAHDVESSLFYCHVDTVADDEIRSQLSSAGSLVDDGVSKGGDFLLRSTESSEIGKRRLAADQDTTIRPELPRRPLSNTAHEAENGRQPRQLAIQRKPIRSERNVEIGTAPPHAVSPRKVLGPRPLGSRPMPDVRGLLPEQASGKENRETLQILDQDTGLSEKPSSFQQNMPPLVRNSEQFIPLKEENSDNISITLIRRNPGTGDQWNVGRMTIQKSKPKSPFRSPPETEDGVKIEISTSGYGKFMKPGLGSEQEIPFQRFLPFRAPRSPNISQSKHQGIRSSIDMASNPNTQSYQAYTFSSPWNGTCEFVTGVAGRSLKCKHTLPTQYSQRRHSYNRLPSTVVSELRFNLPNSNILASKGQKHNRLSLSQDSSHSRLHSYSNSSLRSSHLSSPPLPQRPSLDGRSKHVTDLGRPSLPPRPPSQSTLKEHVRALSHDAAYHNVQDQSDSFENDFDGYEDDWDSVNERMDLSLGQERAGGGFSGKKAKLGKLIISNAEGHAMLDLLVAANMGFWWNAFGG